MGLRGRRGGRVRLGRVWCIRGWISIWLNDGMSAVFVSESVGEARIGLWAGFEACK